eukprot:s1187_g17.t1
MSFAMLEGSMLSNLTLGFGAPNCFQHLDSVSWDQFAPCRPSLACCDTTMLAPFRQQKGMATETALAELAMKMLAVAAGSPCGSSCLFSLSQRIRQHVTADVVGTELWRPTLYRVSELGQALVLCWVAMKLLNTRNTGVEYLTNISDLLLLVVMSPKVWQVALDLKIPLFPLLARLQHQLNPDMFADAACNTTSKDLGPTWRDQWSFVVDGFAAMNPLQINRLKSFVAKPLKVKQDCEWLAVAGNFAMAYRHIEHGSIAVEGMAHKTDLLIMVAQTLALALLSTSRYRAVAMFRHGTWPVWQLLAEAAFMRLLQPDILHTQEFLGWIQPLLPENPVIFEAGSFNGKHSKVMALAWPHGKVFAWEANPTLCRYVEWTIQGLPNVVFTCGGLGSFSGTSRLWHCGDDGSLNVLAVPGCNGKELLEEQVPVKTMQAASEELKVRPHFIWLDVEGSELDVLTAANLGGGSSPPVLSKARVLKVETRKWGASSLKKMQAFLGSEGFSLVYAPVLALYKPPRGHDVRGHFDAIFVRTSLLDDESHCGKSCSKRWQEMMFIGYHQVILACSRSGHFQKALEVFRLHRRQRRSRFSAWAEPFLVNALMSILVVGKSDRQQRKVMESDGRLQTVGGHPFEREFAAASAAAFELCESYEKQRLRLAGDAGSQALNVVKEIQEAKQNPDLLTYKALLELLEGSGCSKAVPEIFTAVEGELSRLAGPGARCTWAFPTDRPVSAEVVLCYLRLGCFAMAAKIAHSDLAEHSLSIVQQFREFWMQGHLCDVVLKSSDGAEHRAHAAVLSATGIFFKNLLGGSFLEADLVQRGQPVEVPVSKAAISALLDYVYGGQPEVNLEAGLELLRLAEAYDLPKLAGDIEAGFRASLDSSAALKVLQEAHGLHDLKAWCEEQVAVDFEKRSQHPDFEKLNASQLARILKREDLAVSREEAVLTSIFTWLKVSKDRNASLGMVLQHVDFQSVSVENLLRLNSFNLSDPNVDDLHREVKDALRVRGPKRTQSLRNFQPKRRCLQHWSPYLGASTEPGRQVLGISCSLLGSQGGFIYVMHNIADFDILCWKHGDPAAQLRQVVGERTRINDVEMGCNLVRTTVSPSGEIFVSDCDNKRLLGFQNGFGREVLVDVSCSDLFCSPSGVLYALDQHKKTVQKLVGSRLETVIVLDDFCASKVFVSKEEVIYLLDRIDSRILRTNPAESLKPAVVGRLPAELKPQLGDLFVTEGGTIYVTGCGKGKVWAFRPGSETYTEVLQCPSGMYPTGILVQDTSLYVSMVEFDSPAGGIYEYVLPPELRLE